MASWVGHPPPSQIPPGTTVHVYPVPKTPWDEQGKPPGAEVTSAAVASDGSLTFTGLTADTSYLGWTSGSIYLHFSVPATEGGAGTVTSVNGKEGAVTLVAADVEAVGTESPAFTGNPTAPLQAKGNSTTRLATTSFAARTQEDGETAAAAKDATAKTATVAEAATKDATLKGEAETKDAAVKTDAESKDATLKTDAESKDATAKSSILSEAVTKDTAAREAAEAASQKRPAVHAVITTEVTAEPDELSPVDATAGNLKIKLKTGLGAGRVVTIEKNDASANTVTAEGNIRGEAGKTFVLTTAKQAITFMTDSAGSWWPISDHITTGATKAMTRQIIRRSISIGAGVAPGNEILLDEYVPIVSGETRKILWVEAHTTSGTIKVAVARGEAGTTAISAYEAIAVTSSIQQISSTISLVDKDRLRITTSAGSTPKGLTITWGEEVVAP